MQSVSPRTGGPTDLDVTAAEEESQGLTGPGPDPASSGCPWWFDSLANRIASIILAKLQGSDFGPTAVISASSAAKALPWRDAEARTWLRREQLIRRVDGRDVVIWGDVLAALRQGSKDTSTWKPARVPRGTPRVPLSQTTSRSA